MTGDGRRNGRESGRSIPPRMDAGGPPGYLRFVLESPRSGSVEVLVRIAVEGPARPLRVELCWWAIDTAAGSDTVETRAARSGPTGHAGEPLDARSATVMGGPIRVARHALVHAVSPRTPVAGGMIRMLGAGIESIGAFALVDRAGIEWDLPDAGCGIARRCVVPLGVRGPATVLLDGVQASGLNVRVLVPPDGSSAALDPVWDRNDGDVLLVAADPLYEALGVLVEDLTERGYTPSTTSVSRIAATYGPSAPGDAIRCAVSEACGSFRVHPLALILVGTASEDVPDNDALATVHVEYEHEFGGYYDSTYAEDPAFGDLLESADLEMELLVGRIPARNASDLTAYVAKLQTYRGQESLPRLLLAVGDASINRDNTDRRRAAGSLLQTVAEGGALSASVLYASSYEPLSDLANRQRALSDLHSSLSDGVGILDLFGNNTRRTNVVHMFESPPGPQLPWLVPELMPTEGRLPIALFHTCLNGAFDEDAPFAGSDSPAETWVRDPSRGAIACIAQSHITTFFDDWELAERIYRRLARGEGASLGALHAGARWDLLSQSSRGGRSLDSVRMMNLLGDPLLVPRLGIEQIRLDGSFEASGFWPQQNRICRDRGWTTVDFDSSCAAARVVSGGPQSPACVGSFTAPVQPVHGSRMLRVEGSHGPGVGRRAAAWRLFDCDLLVKRGSLLSYWVRQDVDPRGSGRLCVDALTESGRIMSRDLLDASGHRADPQREHYALGQWRRVTVRLDPWAGETIRQLFVRYDDPVRPGEGILPMEERKSGPGPGAGETLLDGPPLPGGAFLGFLDDVHIDAGFLDPLLDGDFAVDEDRDRHPDHWFGGWTAGAPHPPTPGVTIQDDGPPALWIDPASGSPGGACQLLGSVDDPWAPLLVRFEARSEDGASIEISLRNPLDGSLTESATVGPLHSTWQECEAIFIGAADSPAVLSLGVLGGRVGLRRLRCEPAQATDLALGPPSSLAGSSVRVGPNPNRGEVRISWSGRNGSPERVDLLDVSGRRIASWQPPLEDQDRCESHWILRDAQGRPLPAGAYFARVTGSWGTTTMTIQLVR